MPYCHPIPDPYTFDMNQELAPHGLHAELMSRPWYWYKVTGRGISVAVAPSPVSGDWILTEGPNRQSRHDTIAAIIAKVLGQPVRTEQEN